MREMQKIHPLRAKREAQNLTREQLAQEMIERGLGLGPATIKRAEHGKSIGPDSRRRLCEFFGCSSEELGFMSFEDSAGQNEGEEVKRNITQPATYNALAQYVQQQRFRLFQAMAPGATALRVGEIIGQDNLFIPPPWKLLHSATPSQNLTSYLIEALLQKRRILLLGEAGQGKTTILKLVFTRLADCFLEDSSSPIPIYIPLREHSSFAESAIDILWMHMGEEFPLPYEEFVSLLRNNQIAFLFDGFDEMRGEITQHSINERAACKIFRYPSVLSCRKSFFDFYLSMSPLQDVYSENVELQPLQALSDPVAHYIAAFCQRQHWSVQAGSAAPSRIIEAIRLSPELQDLAQRPLLLLMILEIFASAGNLDEKQWSITKLYRRYSERWLKHEASKPDSVLKWNEKVAILQEAAWFTYQGTSGFPSSLSEHVTFTHEELQRFVKSIIAQYGGVSPAQLFDDLCFRTLLTASEGASYAFIHKSFQEYFVARYVFECMRGKPDGQVLETIEEALAASLPFDIATFLKKMLKESASYEKDLIVTNLITVYQRNQRQEKRPTTIRQQASYFLTNLATEQAVRFLEEVYREEPNKWVQRGIMVGLALYAAQAEMLERYLRIVQQDREAAAINVGYHLIYYGDYAGDLDSLDPFRQTITSSEKTVAALFRHLENEHYKDGWALNLLTLSALLELQGVSILQTQAWYLPFLQAFLGRDDHRGAILLTEIERLQQLIEGASLGKH